MLGKCYTCLILGFLRNKYRDNKRREMINELHWYHRHTYMGERECYYERRHRAETLPDHFLSDISDGMASSKTVVPWCSDQFEFNELLKMHVRLLHLLKKYLTFIRQLQGVLFHGRRLDFYRTFPNISCGSNAATHFWLLSLEEIYREKGRLPDTLYHQVFLINYCHVTMK